MRLIDGFYAFPLLLLALAIAYSLGPGLNNYVAGHRYRFYSALRPPGAGADTFRARA